MSSPRQRLRMPAALLCSAMTIAICVLLHLAGEVDATEAHSRVHTSASIAAVTASQRRESLYSKATTSTNDPLSTQDASIDLDTVAGEDGDANTDDVDMVDFANEGNEESGAQQEQPGRNLPSQIRHLRNLMT